MMVKTTKCRSCGKDFELPSKPGRPPTRCLDCRENPVQPKSNPIVLLQAPKPQEIKFTENSINDPFVIMVSNLGVAASAVDESKARAAYNRYVNKSCQGYGQVGFEMVELWRLEKKEWILVERFDPAKELH